MKRFMGLLMALCMVSLFVSCDDGGSTSVTVEEVKAADLKSYTSNGVALSANGLAELEGTGEVVELLGEDLGSIIKGLTGIALPSPGLSMGISRGTTDLPTQEEFNEILAALLKGETVSQTATLSEDITLGDETGIDFDSGLLTINADIKASGSADITLTDEGEPELPASGKVNLTATLNVTGSDLKNTLEPYDTPEIIINDFSLKAATETSVTATVKALNADSEPSEGTASITTATALVLAFSLSDYNDGTTQVASGKYIYSMDIAQTINANFAEELPAGTITATLKLSVYDNTNTLVKEWEFDQEDFESLD